MLASTLQKHGKHDFLSKDCGPGLEPELSHGTGRATTWAGEAAAGAGGAAARAGAAAGAFLAVERRDFPVSSSDSTHQDVNALAFQ